MRFASSVMDAVDSTTLNRMSKAVFFLMLVFLFAKFQCLVDSIQSVHNGMVLGHLTLFLSTNVLINSGLFTTAKIAYRCAKTWHSAENSFQAICGLRFAICVMRLQMHFTFHTV